MENTLIDVVAAPVRLYKLVRCLRLMQAKDTRAIDRLEDYFFHPDYVCHVGGNSRISGAHVGWKAYRDAVILGEVGTPGKLRHMAFRGDTIVLSVHLTGTREGKTLDLDLDFRFRFQGTRLIEQRSIPASDDAWSKFWS